MEEGSLAEDTANDDEYDNPLAQSRAKDQAATVDIEHRTAAQDDL